MSKGEIQHDSKALEALRKCLPIVEAAYWDEHTAGVLPGAGFNHKAQHLAGQAFGWRESKTFETWLRETKALLSEGTQG